MNIIFGKEHADRLKNKYTVLELDTVQVAGTEDTVTAYCIVENIDLDDLPMVESMQNLHQDLIVKYQSRNWSTCLELIRRLRGFWNGELDSYYDTLQQRVENLLEEHPGANWSPVVQR